MMEKIYGKFNVLFGKIEPSGFCDRFRKLKRYDTLN